MTDYEIFAFFEKAAEHIGDPNAVADTAGRNGRIEFIKTSTWYVEGDNMAVSSFCIDEEEG
jgi:hypothetical protein